LGGRPLAPLPAEMRQSVKYALMVLAILLLATVSLGRWWK
jgi:hypothetical protein